VCGGGGGYTGDEVMRSSWPRLIKGVTQQHSYSTGNSGCSDPLIPLLKEIVIIMSISSAPGLYIEGAVTKGSQVSRLP
jgi:hypothetical protein